MKSRELLLPIRRNKTDPVSDFWHTLRWGFALSFVVLIVVGLTTRHTLCTSYLLDLPGHCAASAETAASAHD